MEAHVSAATLGCPASCAFERVPDHWSVVGLLNFGWLYHLTCLGMSSVFGERRNTAPQWRLRTEM